MTGEHHKCPYPGCDLDGFLAVRGRPEKKYCEQHYITVVKKLAKISRAMRRIARRNEVDDNRPAIVRVEM